MIGPHLPATLAQPLEATVIYDAANQRVVHVVGFTRETGDVLAFYRLRGSCSYSVAPITSLVFSDPQPAR